MNPHVQISVNMPYAAAVDMVKAGALSPIALHEFLREMKLRIKDMDKARERFLHLLTQASTDMTIAGIKDCLKCDSWLYDLPEFSDWLIATRRVVRL
jgi:hypothetical protein